MHENRSNTARGIILPVLVCLVLIAGSAGAQLTPIPQADSAEEFDAFLQVQAKTKPAEVIVAAAEFERAWPHSPLRGPVCQMELEAYRSINDTANAITAGECVLQFAPGNLAVLAELANIIANTTRDPQRLTTAEGYAHKLLESLPAFKVPRSVLPQDWQREQGQLQSQAHAALGLIAYKRGQTPEAIQEFETATRLAPNPDATQYYRLGLLYGVGGRTPEAIVALKRAAELGDVTIRQLAERQLEKLQR